MLKSAIVQFEGQDMLMSLVPWGPIRRWRVRRRSLDIAFVPKYELAVFLGTPVLRDGQGDGTAKFERLKAAISQAGVPGALVEAFTYTADDAMLAWGDPPRIAKPNDV